MWICRPRHQKKFTYTGYERNTAKPDKQNSLCNSSQQMSESVQWLKLSKATQERQVQNFHHWLQEIQQQNNKIISIAKQNYESFTQKMNLIEQLIQGKIDKQKKIQYDTYELQKQKQFLAQEFKQKLQIASKLQAQKQALEKENILNEIKIQEMKQNLKQKQIQNKKQISNRQTQTLSKLQSPPITITKAKKLHSQYSEIRYQLLRTLHELNSIKNQFKSFLVLNQLEQSEEN